MFVAVVSNVYQLYLILTNRENTSCVDKYILRVASVVRCVAAQYRVHIMTPTTFAGGWGGGGGSGRIFSGSCR